MVHINNPDVRIRPYEERGFERLRRIHDPARRNELALAGLSAAFLPLTIAETVHVMRLNQSNH